MTKTIVTGGTGFIGSHLCEYLIGKGDKVICIDNKNAMSIELRDSV